jgi:hypothetical protein
MPLIIILRSMPVSYALLERCFSTMAIVKTDWRSRLGEKVVEYLLRLKCEGPDATSSEVKLLIERAVEHFFKLKLRRPRTAYDADEIPDQPPP